MLPQHLDEVKVCESEQNDELVLCVSVITGILQYGEHLLSFALCHHGVTVVLAQLSLQPVRIDVMRVQTLGGLTHGFFTATKLKKVKKKGLKSKI